MISIDATVKLPFDNRIQRNKLAEGAEGAEGAQFGLEINFKCSIITSGDPHISY